MKEIKQKMNHSLLSFFYFFVILMAIWMALTMSVKKQELVAGVIISLIFILIFYASVQLIGFPRITLKKIGFLCIYIIVLFKEIIIANLDVVNRVIHPKMPITPGIIIIKTELKQDMAKMILANSITLAPSTFTLDIDDDKLLIHWINVKTDDIGEATKIIGARFEKYLKIIFS